MATQVVNLQADSKPTLKQRTLDVTIYGNLQKVTDVLSLSRVRIFYTGLNRNRTFISEEFAQQLINSLPYTPVKGIFDNEEVDFTDHGEASAEGKIYGIVPENPNFAWEEHMDDDGVTRTYACADVLLYTALYPEAKIIPGSSQSMEIYDQTCEGEWKIWPDDGLPYFHFEKGCLLGLQVLGARTEPCFEGASFFSLYEDMQQLMSYLKDSMKFEKKEEKKLMDKNLFFRLSDNEKAELIWSSLNPNFNEEGGWQVDYYLLDVYDDYALVSNKDGYARVSYAKNENDTVTIGEPVKCYIVDITETEMMALEAMKAANGTYEAVNTKLAENDEKIASLENELATANEAVETAKTEAETKATEYSEVIAEKDATIEAVNTTLSEANEKYSSLEAEKVGLENEKNDLLSEVQELREFKHNIETAQKKNTLTEMAEFLTEEANQNFNDTMDNFSVEDFKKEVYATAALSNQNLFHKNDPKPELFYNANTSSKTESLAEQLLNDYKTRNGGNK